VSALLTAGTFVAGCSSNDNTSTTLTASAIGVVSGNAQVGVVGTGLAIPFVVHVTDQNGAAMSGVIVNFAATGGASLMTASATTDANGQATDSLTLLGTVAGADTVTASIGGVTPSAIFSITANPGAPAAVVVVSGNNQSATAGTTLAAALVVEVTDAFGNAVPNAAIDWSTSAGVLTGASSELTTDITGSVQDVLVLPVLTGAVTVTATIHGTATAATFTETAM
jgi:adhesin/invasin